MTYDLIVKGGTVVNHAGAGLADVGITAGRIAAIGDLSQAPAAEVLEAAGLHVLPGVIDPHVHFREPGFPAKETFDSGSKAAVLGGVTTVFEMPNTNPTTTDAESLADKMQRAEGRMRCNYAFYIGGTAGNADRIDTLERLPGCAGFKIFVGSSTGPLLMADDETIFRAMHSGRRRLNFHAEDEPRLIERKVYVQAGRPETHPVWRDAECARLATERLIRLARRAGRRINILHVSAAEEIPLLAGARDIATMEVTPQHLTLAAPECYREKGAFAQLNPPIRAAEHRAALWAAVRDGLVDVLGSDHAPHTIAEKQAMYPATPSGLPGVQTLVPVMLTHVAEGRLSLARFVDLTSHGVQRVYGMAGKGRLAAGFDADLTIVDLKTRRTITNDWIASLCGWTPFDGFEATGWPIATVVNGRVAMRDGEVLGAPGGTPVRFEETLPPLQ